MTEQQTKDRMTAIYNEKAILKTSKESLPDDIRGDFQKDLIKADIQILDAELKGLRSHLNELLNQKNKEFY